MIQPFQYFDTGGKLFSCEGIFIWPLFFVKEADMQGREKGGVRNAFFSSFHLHLSQKLEVKKLFFPPPGKLFVAGSVITV